MFIFMIILLILLLQRFLFSGRESRARKSKLDLITYKFRESGNLYETHAAQNRPRFYNLRQRTGKQSLQSRSRSNRLKQVSSPISTLEEIGASYAPHFFLRDTVNNFKDLCREFYLAARANKCDVIVSCDSDKGFIPDMIRVVKEALTFYRRYGFVISRQVIVMVAPRSINSREGAKCNGVTFRLSRADEPIIVFVDSDKNCKICVEETVKTFICCMLQY
jgi:hypothetical protein